MDKIQVSDFYLSKAVPLNYG